MKPNRRDFLRITSAAFAGASCGQFHFHSRAFAADLPNDVFRIEEDWEIKVSVPNPFGGSPELIASIGPRRDDREATASLLINHATQPGYDQGGLQFQLWKYGVLLDCVDLVRFRQLATCNESIRFTLVMECLAGSLRFGVEGGSSVTFGEFGAVNLQAGTGLLSLQGYSPDDSVARSQVTVGAQRLSRYRINEVRYLRSNEEIEVDSTQRSVL